MKRDTVRYCVGSEHAPGDPLGRSSLVIQVDGSARLDQTTRAGETSWTGTVPASVLDDLWLALELAGFPDFPRHPVPAGSAIRELTVGTGAAYIAYHAAESMPGYAVAFRILDTLIRQLSEDTVKVIPELAPPMVTAVTRLTPEERRALMPRVSPGTAYLLGYLPAFDRQRLAALAIEHEVELPLDAEYMQSRLGTPLLRAAWRAGQAAGRVRIASRAEDQAAELRASADQLTQELVATGLPLVISQAGNVAEMVRLSHVLGSPPAELTRDLERFLQIKVRELDVEPPPVVSDEPTDEERALLARIVATPSDLGLRLELAALAERRNDDRAKLIRIQLTSIDDDAARQAADLVRSHPEWSAPLQALGARDMQFRGGFPDTITVDAGVLLDRGAELFQAAPLRGLRVRNARGRTGEVVRSPLLATIESLDLDQQAVSDDDLIALSASPHVTRLRQLDLRFNPLSSRGIEALAASRRLGALLIVNLDGNPDDPVDRLTYYDETHQHALPTEAGKALEAKYGPLRWLRRL